MPIEVGIEFDGGIRQIERLQMRSGSGSFSSLISVDQEPINVVLDPDPWVLMEANFVKRD